MSQRVLPKTFLIGYTAADFAGVRAYLQHTGQEKFVAQMEAACAAGLAEGEILCSLAAKICYKSLVEGFNDNLSRVRDIQSNLKDGVLATGHGSVLEHCYLNFVVTGCSRVFCYEPGTEIFTRERGWQKVESLVAADQLLTLDPETGTAGWSPIIKLHSMPYEGELYGWTTSQMASPLMTPDHLLWAARYDLRRARGLSCREIALRQSSKIPVADLTGTRFVIRHDVPFSAVEMEDQTQLGEHSYNTADLFAWLGWMATDGGFVKERPNQCVITQSKPKNLPRLQRLMTRLFGPRWRRHGPYASEQIQYVINNGPLAEWAKKMIGSSKQSRFFAPALLSASLGALRAFFKAAVAGDGSVHKDNGHICLYCPSLAAAGQYQVIAARLGYAANVRPVDRRGEEHELNGATVGYNQPYYAIELDRRGAASLISAKHQHRQAYSGLVHCPETKEGIIYVRRAGQAFWCGNTHELVRHRAGTAFSQTSGRYVRIDPTDPAGLQLVIDPILDPITDLVEEAALFLEKWYKRACDRMGLNGTAAANDAWRQSGAQMAMRGQAALTPAEALAQIVADPNATELLRDCLTDKPDFARKKKVTSALRRLLPNGQANEICFSLNVRALRHFVMQRTAPDAEWEIRLVGNQVYDLARAKFPLLFSDACHREANGQRHVWGMKLQPYDLTEEQRADYLREVQISSSEA